MKEQNRPEPGENYQGALKINGPDEFNQAAITYSNTVLKWATQIKDLLQVKDPTEKDLQTLATAGADLRRVAGFLQILIDLFISRSTGAPDPPELKYHIVYSKTWLRYNKTWFDDVNKKWVCAPYETVAANVYQLINGIMLEKSGVLIYCRDGSLHFTQDRIEIIHR